MEKLIITTGILFLLSHTINAQKTIEINFDSSAKSWINTTQVDNIEPGDFYRVEIKNINLNLFKVSLTAADTTLSKPQQTPAFGSLDVESVTKVIAGIGPFNTEITQIRPWSSAIRESVTWMKAEGLPSPPAGTEKKIITERMEQEKDALSDAKHSAEQIASHIDSLKLQVYSLKLHSLQLANPQAPFNFSQALAEIEHIRKNIGDLREKMTMKSTAYTLFSKAHKDVIAKDESLSSGDKAIKDTYDKFLSSLSDALASVSADKANELLSSVVFIENNKSNAYISLPMQFTAEQTRVPVFITPRDEKYNLPSYYSQIVFPSVIKTYTVVGISFYGSTLCDKAYSTSKTKVNDSVFSYGFKEENTGGAEMGIAALLRHGRKLGDKKNFGGHFSIGAGVSIAGKIKPRVLLGGGLSFGRKHMVAIDAGAIAGYVDRLSNVMDLSEEYPEKPDNITVSKLGVGMFMAVGYIYQF